MTNKNINLNIIKKTLLLDRNFIFIIFLSFIQVLAETFSVFSIMPFITLISNPSMIDDNEKVTFIFHNVQSIISLTEKEFILFIGMIGIIILILSFIVRSFALFKINLYIEHKRDDISHKVFKNILHCNYEEFISNHNAEFIKTIITEVDQVVAQVLRPLILLISNTMLAIVMMLVLFLISFKVTIVLFIVLFFAYLFIFFVVKSKFLKMGQDVVFLNKHRSQILIESLNNIRLLRLRNKESIFLNKYYITSKEYSSYQASNQTLAHIPSYLVETFVLIMVLIGGLYLTSIYEDLSSGVNELLPYIGMYAMAGLKLKPAFQNIYQGLSSAKWGSGMINSINRFLKESTNEYELFRYEYSEKNLIEFNNISYQVGNTRIVENCNLTISKGEFVAIIGETGCGKSTILNIMCGLLIPSSGVLKISKKNISLLDWQKKICYVDQTPLLFDDSILNNIIFGADGPIDKEKLKQAIKLACLDSILDKDIEDFYIGENGSNLSGGQRQRLAIARAFYYQPEILIMDEPTSALDPETSQKIIRNLENLKGNITIIIITHNMNNIDGIDRIIKVERGGYVK